MLTLLSSVVGSLLVGGTCITAGAVLAVCAFPMGCGLTYRKLALGTLWAGAVVLAFSVLHGVMS